MTVTAPETTPHASSVEVLGRVQLALMDASTELAKIDLRSLKGTLREEVRDSREAVAQALRTSRR